MVFLVRFGGPAGGSLLPFRVLSIELAFEVHGLEVPKIDPRRECDGKQEDSVWYTKMTEDSRKYFLGTDPKFQTPARGPRTWHDSTMKRCENSNLKPHIPSLLIESYGTKLKQASRR